MYDSSAPTYTIVCVYIYTQWPPIFNTCFFLLHTLNSSRHEFLKVFRRDLAPRWFDKVDQFLQIFGDAARCLCRGYPVPPHPKGALLSRVQAAGINTSFCHVTGSISRLGALSYTATKRHTWIVTILLYTVAFRDPIVSQEKLHYTTRFYI